MGTWGTGSFENDQALDWLAELMETNDLSLLEESLVIKDIQSYLDVNIAIDIIVACEIVAALLNKSSEKLPNDAKKWIKKNNNLDAMCLVAKCKNGLSRIVAKNSEIKELWEESDSFGEWMTKIKELTSRINSI
jgi:hypothetical protein